MPVSDNENGYKLILMRTCYALLLSKNFKSQDLKAYGRQSVEKAIVRDQSKQPEG
jgi:hypothetical protein